MEKIVFPFLVAFMLSGCPYISDTQQRLLIPAQAFGAGANGGSSFSSKLGSSKASSERSQRSSTQNAKSESAKSESAKSDSTPSSQTKIGIASCDKYLVDLRACMVKTYPGLDQEDYDIVTSNVASFIQALRVGKNKLSDKQVAEGCTNDIATLKKKGCRGSGTLHQEW